MQTVTKLNGQTMNSSLFSNRLLTITVMSFILFTLMLFGNADAHTAGTANSVPAPLGNALYIVQFEGVPLATYKGTQLGLAATNPQTAGAHKLDFQSIATQKYSAHLRQQRLNLMAKMAEVLNRPVKIIHQYDTAFNGVAVKLNTAEAAIVANQSGIVRLEIDRQINVRAVASTTQLSSSDLATVVNGEIFIAALLFLCALLWTLRRGKNNSWGWIAISASILLLTAACGNHDSHNEIRLEAPDGTACSPGAAWIGAPGVWDGSSTGALPATMGEGIVIGIIDSGISPHSPSFAAIGDDGYEHTNPRGKYYGVCDPGNTELYNPNFPCNEKLIGAWNCVPDEYNAVDFYGHGSHVAATAAGNIVDEAIVHFDSGFNLSATISGVAPHANLISYNTMDEAKNINDSAVLAAIEQAIKDGVDVISISLGGGITDPWQDTLFGLPLLNARKAGIFVAVAAGNEGPEMATLNTPSIAPWLTAVGASTHDVRYINALTYNEADGTPAEIIGLGITPGYGPATVVYAGDYGDALCQGTFNAPFNGEIVICDRGEIARVDKGKNVKANGGGGMIHAEVNPGGSEALVEDAHFLPATHIAQPDADNLKAWLATTGDHQGTISGMMAQSDATSADMIVGFSSRGWNRATPSIIKPDIVAPGSSIIAPVIDGVGYAIYQGTSMASPHVAGAFALLKALHPNWSPAQAQTALMTTAIHTVTIDDEGTLATPFDTGAGRIDVGQAAQAALVFDENSAGYENGNPELYWQTETLGVGVAKQINLASFGDNACINQCSWQRTLQNVSDATTTWRASVIENDGLTLTVTPEHFQLAPSECIVLTLDADTTAIPLEEWAFGRITLTEADGNAPDAIMPVAVRSMAAKLPPSLEIVTSEQAGTKQFFQLEATNISALTVTTFGLKEANVMHDELGYDTPPLAVTAGDGGTTMLPIVVPDNTMALFIDLESAESPDLNLYAGKEGTLWPSASSYRSGSTESILITSPESGNWWIAVNSYQPNRTGDQFTLRYAAVTTTDTETTNLSVTPDSLIHSPFSLILDWNLPESVAGDYWYAILQLGTAPESSDNIGTIPLKLVIE